MTTQTPEPSTCVNLTIDGKLVTVPKGTTVYHAATNQGIDLPIFCYQDRMPPFGACRVCLVEVEKMGKLQTSCTLEATEGMVVKTQSQIAKEGREEILEFLLINHPLDCPVCDKGGECPLQDQTITFGPQRSRFYEEKRQFPKHHALGPLLMLDRERCIACARCTRFGEIVAGDHALEFIERGFKTEVGTPGGRPVESKFIGNTIMICPVGALTSDVYRFRARPWDNKQTETTCTLCPVGCSMVLDQRDGEIMRTRSVENKSINDIWMCDKGWFGYEFSNYRARLQKPLIRRNGQLEIASWEDALSLVATKMKEAKSSGKVAGWGGNPLTTEENFFFQKLLRASTGTNHLDHRIGSPLFNLDEEVIPPGMEISVGECEKLSNALLLGTDLTEEFPVIWLRLKQGINQGTKTFFVGHYAPETSQYFQKTILHTPDESIKNITEQLNALSDQFKAGVGAIFVGRQYLASPQRAAILSLLLDFQKTHSNVSLNILEGRGNSLGARIAGVHPQEGPFGQRLENPGLDALGVLETAAKEGWDFLYVAGADPVQKLSSKLWKEAKAKLGFLVVQDIFLTETARQADVVLPSLCYVEKSGTFLTLSQQVQKIHPGKDLPEGIYSDLEIFRLIAEKLNVKLAFDKTMEEMISGHLSVKQKISRSGSSVASKNTSKTGIKAIFARSLFDNGIRMKHNPHLLQVVKEPRIRLNPNEANRLGLQDGETVRVKANGVSIRGVLKIERKIADGTVVLPLGFDALPVRDLAGNLLNGLDVEIAIETR